MPTIERSAVIRAGRAALFELTQDYGRRLGWDCFLKEARLLDGATNAAVGVRAWCVAWHGLGMETEYVTVSPPAVAAVKMTRGPAVLGTFAGSWRFAEERPGATHVTFRYQLQGAAPVACVADRTRPGFAVRARRLTASGRARTGRRGRPLIPRHPTARAPVFPRLFGSTQPSCGLLVPRHRQRRQIRPQLLRRRRPAQHHIGPRLRQHRRQRQGVQGRVQPRRFLFQQSPFVREGRVRDCAPSAGRWPAPP